MAHPIPYEMVKNMALSMRAIYGKGLEDRLEQVVEWLRNNLDESYIWEHTGQSIDRESIIADLKEAMRPTTATRPTPNKENN
jgi:hypothetical protein